MSIVYVHQGDVLNVVVSQTAASFNVHVVGYDQLLSLVVPTKHKTSRKSLSQGTKFSRQVKLYCNAIMTGKWCGRGDIDKNEMVSTIYFEFSLIINEDMLNVTPKAKKILSNLVDALRPESDTREGLSHVSLMKILEMNRTISAY